jgi:hypothetical protein
MPGIDTSRIAYEKQSRLVRRLSSIEERVDSLTESLREFVNRLEFLESRMEIGPQDYQKYNIPEDIRYDLPGYENEEDTVPMLRSQLDQLGVKYHSAHKEKKLRKLLNEALVREGEKDAKTE